MKNGPSGPVFCSLHFRGDRWLTPDWQTNVRCRLLGTFRYPVAWSDGFRPLRASHLIRCAHPSGQPTAVTLLRFVALACPRESNQREGHPIIRPRLRRGSLIPSPLQGHAAKGRPWPIAALATSMSLMATRPAPYVAIPFGLLKGMTWASPVRSQLKSKSRRR